MSRVLSNPVGVPIESATERVSTETKRRMLYETER